MTNDRLHYLDNLRVFAMLLGILVHTCTTTDFGRLQLVQPISHNFRMGTFFAVSGFFGALLLTRYPVERFLRERLTALTIPLLTCLVLLNPITLWLVYRLHNAQRPCPALRGLWIVMQSFDGANQLSGAIIWHLHLWFLISLAFYCLTAPWVLRLLTRAGKSRFLSEAFQIIPQQFHALLVALAVAALVIFFRGLFTPCRFAFIPAVDIDKNIFYIVRSGFDNKVHRIQRDQPMISPAVPFPAIRDDL